MSEVTAPSIKRVAPGTRSADAAIKHAKKLMSEKRFDEALDEFQEVVRAGQANAFVHTAIGRIKFTQRDLDGSLRSFQEAINLDPTQSQPYLRGARIHLMRGDLDKAREGFGNAIRVNNKSAVAYAGLGLVQVRAGASEDALAQWKQALVLNPRFLVVRKRLATLLQRMGRPVDALAQINAAVRIDPEDVESHTIKGRLHLRAQENAEALKAFEKARSLDAEGEHSEVIHGLAESYLATGDLEQAETTLRAIPAREVSPIVHKLWGDLYAAQGLHKQAVEEYQSASLGADEELDLGLDTMDMLADDEDDEKWVRLAAQARRATDNIIAKKRELAESSAT